MLKTFSKRAPREPTGDAPEERWEIAAQWRAAWRGLKYAAYGLLALTALVTAGQVFTFFQMFASVRPALGWAFLAAAAFVAYRFIALPIVEFLKTPEAAKPPDVKLDAKTVTADDVRARTVFDAAYLKRLAGNPLIANKKADAQAALEELRALEAQNAAPGAAATALASFERARITPILEILDERVDEEIRREAIAVGAATAVSMNGSIDAFIVLWRNVNLVARVARVYYGRPSLAVSLMILRDVAVAVLLSRALDDVTRIAGDALGGLITKLGGMVVAPIMDGSVNALMTLKLGYLAKRRCRAFAAWSEKNAAQATLEVFDQVKRESAGLVGDLVKTVGGAAGAFAGATERVLSAPRSAWALVQGAIVRKPSEADPSSG
ncbi:MAG: YcjF family protein [Parvularculaceae bacterium]